MLQSLSRMIFVPAVEEFTLLAARWFSGCLWYFMLLGAAEATDAAASTLYAAFIVKSWVVRLTKWAVVLRTWLAVRGTKRHTDTDRHNAKRNLSTPQRSSQANCLRKLVDAWSCILLFRVDFNGVHR